MTLENAIALVVWHPGFRQWERVHSGHVGDCPQQEPNGLPCWHFQVGVSLGRSTAWWCSEDPYGCVRDAAEFITKVQGGALVRWCQNCTGHHLGLGDLCAICSASPAARAMRPTATLSLTVETSR